jgi:hypothetical protein
MAELQKQVLGYRKQIQKHKAARQQEYKKRQV